MGHVGFMAEVNRPTISAIAECIIASNYVTENRMVLRFAVERDGKEIGTKPKEVYIVLNKPIGITCTTDMRVAGNIIEFMDYHERIFPIGRLDKPSEGLILLTNDGTLSIKS